MRQVNGNYLTRVVSDPSEIASTDWDGLLGACEAGDTRNPFMRYAYLQAMHASQSAVPETGWTPRFVTLWSDETLVGACALYLKVHSYGEYVFDWAWARAYQEHQVPYYPKALIASPFTPVPGPRLLASNNEAKHALLAAVLATCESLGVSSLHLLFGDQEDLAVCESAGLMTRQTVQFHWTNRAPNDSGSGYADFDDFLSTLNQEKRKKIKQERRKVSDAGVSFKAYRGGEISTDLWELFYQCYSQTYLEHGNAPYLSRDFFQRMQDEMPENWLLFVGYTPDGTPFATSLIGLATHAQTGEVQAAFGRYWGALARVDCLHFEACYYQPIAWCIANGVKRFEGGAQGEHKMARALMPVTTYSAHWLAHPSFAEAVGRYLDREREGIADYVDHLSARSPFKGPAP